MYAGGNAPGLSWGTRGLAWAVGDVGARVGVGEGADFWGGTGVGEGEGRLRDWVAEARSACSAGTLLVMVIVGVGTGLGGGSEVQAITELGCSAGPAAGAGVVLVEGGGARADFGGSTRGEPWASIVDPLLFSVLPVSLGSEGWPVLVLSVGFMTASALGLAFCTLRAQRCAAPAAACALSAASLAAIPALASLTPSSMTLCLAAIAAVLASAWATLACASSTTCCFLRTTAAWALAADGLRTAAALAGSVVRAADPIFVAVAAEVLVVAAACALRSLPDWRAPCDLHNSVLWGLSTSLTKHGASCKHALVHLTAAAVAASALLLTTACQGCLNSDLHDR